MFRSTSSVTTSSPIPVVHSNSWIMRRYHSTYPPRRHRPAAYLLHLASCRVPVALTRRRVLFTRLMMHIFNLTAPPKLGTILTSNILGFSLSPLYHYHLGFSLRPLRHLQLYLPAFPFIVLIVQSMSNISLAMLSVVYPHPRPFCTLTLHLLLVRLVDMLLSNLCGPSTYPSTGS